MYDRADDLIKDGLNGERCGRMHEKISPLSKVRFVQEVAVLRKELTILENKMGQQVKYFKTEREFLCID